MPLKKCPLCGNSAEFINPPFWITAIGRFECEECGSFAITSVAQTIIAKAPDQERIAISKKPKEAAPGTYLEISGEKTKGVEGLRYIFKKIEVYRQKNYPAHQSVE